MKGFRTAFLVFFLFTLRSQAMVDSLNKPINEKLIQFSGYVMTPDSLMGISYAHITILNRGRVATAGLDGFFSFVAHEGDTCFFTCVGFKPSLFIIPKNLPNNKFSIVQLMSRTEYMLRQTVIYPWGGRDNFREAFLKQKTTTDEIERAEKNLERERMIELAEKMEKDGIEASKIALQSKAGTYYYYKQAPPQNILNPLAWAQFIRAWKRGDFKKKGK